MPSTINGIGTWYYGRDNVHRHGGTCEFCQNHGTLTSYDTTLFFTLLYVPLVPLRRMHVIDECPSCRKHRAMSLRQWEDLRERTLADTFAAYRNNLRDEKLAIEAVMATTAFRHQEAFARVAPVVRENLPGSADVNMVLAGAHEFFGDQEAAAAAYRRSLAVKPDVPEVRRALAVTLLRLGRPDEAAPLVADVLKAKDPEHVGLPYLLVEAYQAAGRHQDALRLLDAIVEAFPDVADDSSVRRYRKTSEKHRGSGKPIASPSLRYTPGAAVERGRFVAVPRLVAPVLLLVALGIFTVVSFGKAGARPVYFVNGLTRAYDIEVNGKRYSLGAGSRQLILKVKEGEVRVRVPDASLQIPEQVCRVETSFWSRPFVDSHFVINPDQAAILYVERTEYSATPDYDRVLPVTIHTGRLLYDFSEVDYLFQEFPSSLTGSTGSGTIEKKRLGQQPVEPVGEAFLVLLRNAGKEGAGRFALRQLEATPEKTEVLPYLCYALPPEEALAFIRPRLERRPVSVEWHRHYQDLMGAQNPGHDLYDEYKALYQEQPDDVQRIYLLGRVAPEREEARRLLRRAAEASPPSVWALQALAYDAMCEADFRAALEYARKAIALAPGEENFRVHESEALLALGEYDTLIKRAAEGREGRPGDFALVKEEAHLRACRGDLAGARALVDTYMATMPPQVGPLTRGQLRASLDAAVAYAAGDASKYAAMSGDALTTDDRYAAAVCAGRFDDAVAALKEVGVDASAAPVEPYLTLYLAATTRGDSQAARKFLDVAVRSMRKQDADGRRFADYLAAILRPPPEEAAAIPLRPSTKRLALAVMAARFPEDRALYAELARPHNYDRRFPYLLVAQALGRP
jgi:tetratricopeptide (TPR) repeat protein